MHCTLIFGITYNFFKMLADYRPQNYFMNASHQFINYWSRKKYIYLTHSTQCHSQLKVKIENILKWIVIKYKLSKFVRGFQKSKTIQK